MVMGGRNEPGMAMIPVYYSPEMVADSGAYSPSSAKPIHVVASWRERGFPIEVIAPPALSAEDLALAHDREMVDDILACRRLNGFRNRSRTVARTLPFTAGAMYAAALRALADQRVAVAPCSGFHHAGYSSSHGFCTFNGLMVAARLLHDRHGAKRVAILDFDEHYGDGTDDILNHLEIDWVDHYSAGEHEFSADEAERFLAQIPIVLDGMARRGSQLVLYQAGADPHIDDPLGGFLSTEQLYRRDRAVFESCRRLGMPVAWNLAGGYQMLEGLSGADEIRPVLEIHDNTMRACVAVYAAR